MRATADQVRWIPIEEIMEEDASHAADDGVILLSERSDGTYTLLGGHDRLRRMKEAGQGCVDAVLHPTEKLEERLSALLDGMAKGTLHYLDEAQACSDLLKSGQLTAQQLAERVGRTAATIRRKLRLLELGEDTMRILREKGLCERYAQELLRIPGQPSRLRVLKQVMDGGLSVKETEKLIDGVLSRMPLPVSGGRRLKPLMRDYRLYLNAIRGIVEQMSDAGLDAAMQVNVGRHVAEVRITIPIFARGNK